MYGYVTPYIPELKIKEYELYKAYYCGLCKSIGRLYGQTERLLLNYDCTFLAILLSGLTTDTADFHEFRCAVHPAKRRGYIGENDALDYAAAVTVILAKEKLRDNIADGEHKISGMAASKLTERAYGEACKRYPETADAVSAQLRRLSRLEADRCANIDETADVFGEMLAHVMTGFPDKTGEIGSETKEILRNFGYNMGRWIYIIDAADDIEKDIKHGSYNPLRYSENTGAAEYIYPGVVLTLANIGKAFELLRFRHSKEVVGNIVYQGLARTTEKILGRNGERFGKSV